MANLDEVCDICRICLKKIGLDESNQSEIISENICSLIMECTSVQVTINDGFSNHICLSCYELLNKFWEFCQMCRKSDEILKSYMNSLEYKRNLLNFIELKPDIAIADVKTLNLVEWPAETKKSDINNEASISLDHWSEEESSEANIQLSINLEQWSKTVKLDKKIELPATLGQWPEADNLQGAVSLNLDEISEAIYWDTNSNSETGNLDPLDGTDNLNQSNHEIGIDKSDARHQSRAKTTARKAAEKKPKRKKEPRVCYICGKQTITITEHLLTHGKLGDCKCDKCGQLFKNRKELSAHQAKHKPPKQKSHKCDMCGGFFVSRATLVRHVREIHFPTRDFECLICSKRFPSDKNLKLHYMTHTGEKRYKCRLCPEQFVDKVKFKAHKMNEHNIQPAQLFNCDKCNLTFLYNYQLLRHLKSSLHEVGGIFECEICSEKFNMKSLFLRHMHLKHEERDKKKDRSDSSVKCQVCNKEFKYLRNLLIHEKIHRPEDKKHKCEFCDKAFLVRSALRDHRATHTGEWFKCNSCDESFINYRQLRIHIKACHEDVE